MDNLSSHTVEGIREAIESTGATLRYLPAYSPDPEPIKPAFGKFKTPPRDGSERTTATLMKLCGQVLDLLSESEIQNYFHHSGYRRT